MKSEFLNSKGFPMLRLASILTLCALALMAATPSAAQDPDWNSEPNRTWWNGVTGAELQELVVEAGGVWSDVPDGEGLRVGRIDWPDLAGVVVREFDCPLPERAMADRNCGTMVLSVAVDQPADLEAWWTSATGWLAFGRIDNLPGLYRTEHHAFGTTRGHVLSTLMLFRARAVADIARMNQQQGSGW
jgi:hypothetical protein